MNIDQKILLLRLRKANIQSVNGGPLYVTSNVDLDLALKALEIEATSLAAEAPPPPILQPEAKLAADAATAAPTTLAAAPAAYMGNENEATPQFILEGAFSDDYRDFPEILCPDSDKVYRPVHINPDRQYRMIMRGYKFVMDPKHIARIGNGTLERFVNSKGRVQYKDRELAFLPIELAREHRRRRQMAFLRDREQVDNAFLSNVEEGKRRLGRGGDAKLEAFDMPEGEASERKEFAEARRAGVQRVAIDMGAVKKRVEAGE
jgi:hypothetical protein